MDYFETELRNIAGPLCADISYSDQVCYVQLSETTRAAIQFDSCGFSEEYPALYVSVMDNTGEIDHIRLYFTDMGIPAVWDTPDSNGIFFWAHEGIAEWCGIQPTPENYRKMFNVLEQYLETFVSSQVKWAKIRHKVYQAGRIFSPGSIPVGEVSS